MVFAEELKKAYSIAGLGLFWFYRKPSKGSKSLGGFKAEITLQWIQAFGGFKVETSLQGILNLGGLNLRKSNPPRDPNPLEDTHKPKYKMTDKPKDWVFTDPRLKELKQEYANYTEEDFKVWRILFERQMPNLPKAASQAYLDGVEKVQFTADRIANFQELNEILETETGWKVQVVPGLIDDDLFFGLLNNKRFPSSTWLRKMEQLDYLEEPDMFHDAFAHMPLLTNQHYVDFLEKLSGIALKHIENPWAIQLLSRIYWFTIEFGLIRENGELRVYGAGILSSAGETKFSLSDEPKHFPYSVRQIMNTEYWKDRFQDKYWVIDSYEQLFESLPEIEEVLEEMLAEKEARS